MTDSTKEHRDTCSGDSGGPFVVYDIPNEKYNGKSQTEKLIRSPEGDTLKNLREDRGVLWGVTSFGSDKCDKHGVYTLVANKMEWMYGILSKSSSFLNYK
jgi:secreted trypsin-like serine protease